ncbi:hypothetical protein VNI00_007274 [Paramarasmius palmivorus]|uniref:Uncharacterized protein n=1 Tax=Paramarasmius palmivorus TaxID=297713 RepID=A0AAW0D3Z2_9AGAR
MKSSAFIHNNMFGTKGVVQTVDIQKGCATPNFNAPITEETGSWMEGLSILMSTTGNSSMTKLARNAIEGSTTRVADWQSEGGVLSKSGGTSENLTTQYLLLINEGQLKRAYQDGNQTTYIPSL